MAMLVGPTDRSRLKYRLTILWIAIKSITFVRGPQRMNSNDLGDALEHHHQINIYGFDWIISQDIAFRHSCSPQDDLK